MVQDKYLIWQFNRGRRTALHQIYERHKDYLLTLAAALLTNVAGAEDVIHDVFIGFILQQGRFRLTGSLRGYLATCVANAARNLNKAESRRHHAPLDEIRPPLAQHGDPEFTAIFGEESGRLAWALEQLPYEQREALVLRAYGQMKFAAIAAQQETSIHTAQGRYRYALDKLRELMTQGCPRNATPTAPQPDTVRKFYI
ncbi:RNA polymerase sigma factor [Planctomycetota bacterium]